MKQILTILFLISFAFINATIINVPADQSTIQAGIDAAINGDIVLVQPDTYYENINFNGKLITVGSLFLITRDASYISQTIINGNATGSVVTFYSGEDLSTVLAGFTITNGSATRGGGIYCEESSPTLHSLIISGNSASNSGGGISCFESCYPRFENVTITENIASDSGGGISCVIACNPSLENVTISGNSAQYYGAGVYCLEDSYPSLENVTISDNFTQGNGGGIYCEHLSSPSLLNSIMWNNSPQEIYIAAGGSITTTYSDIEGGWTGVGNIDSNPLFVDAGGGDYHLQAASPCIDAGNPVSPLDPDETRADMGTFYFNQYNGPTWHISTTGSDVTGSGCELFPFGTIQHGINTSSDTDTVLVQPGTYVENINFNGKLITVGSLFLTTQDTTYISSTIIDGNNNGSVVTFESGENSTSVLSGFSIINGNRHNGGGIYCSSSSPYLNHVTISGNSASGSSYANGGGIYCGSSSNPSMQNVTISGNSTNNDGGGIFFHNYSNPSLINVTITDNSANNVGGGIYCSNSTPVLINSILWNNSPQEINILSGSVTATYSDIEGGWVGTGNIYNDPLFVDPYNNNFNLLYNSSCIDTGDPSSPLDPDGSRADMGAYFFDQSFSGEPTITAITDVPYDQGRYVQVIWDKSPYDIPGSSVPIESYSVWRYDDIFDDRGKYEIYNDPRDILEKATENNIKKYFWQRDNEILTFIAQVPAVCFDQYAVVSPTLIDSSSVSINYSTFTVLAQTDLSYINYLSLPDSGYSVDNIAPDETDVYIAQNGSSMGLIWDEVEYGTFQGNSYPEINGIWYKIYAGDSPDFICDEVHLIDTVTNLIYDYPISGEKKKFFKIVVSDQP